MIDLRGLFTPQAVAQRLKTLPIIKTPIIDEIFVDRPQNPFALVGIEDITAVVKAMPVTRRGAASIPATGETMGYSFIEPLPVNIHSKVTAADLNNLKMLSATSKEAWATAKTDYLRKAARLTTEGIAVQSLSGAISWPCQVTPGVFETYAISYGSPLTVVPGVLWDAGGCTVSDVFATLQAMEEAVNEMGYSDIVYWAGKTAYLNLMKVAENSKTTAKIRVEMTDQGINIGGYLVKRRAEKYTNPQTGSPVPYIADKAIKAVARDAGSKLIYSAIDDLDANLLPMPFFPKAVKTDDPSGYTIIGQSKPLPVANPKGICDATVVS